MLRVALRGACLLSQPFACRQADCLAAPARRQQHPPAAAHAAMPSSASASAEEEKKLAARAAVKAALRRMTAEQMAAESAAIAERLAGSGLLAGARRLAIFVHCPALREPDSSPLLQAAWDAGARVYAPRVQDREANMHFLHIASPADLAPPAPPFGIREPTPAELDGGGGPREDAAEMEAPLDAVVMPGLAFDRAGERLGRGGGYYDKFLATCAQRGAARGWPPPLLVGLAFRPQVVESVPMTGHDVPVDILVTPDEVIACSARGAAAAAEHAGRGAAGGGGAAPGWS